MKITVKHTKDNTIPFIWKIDVCCKSAARHLFHPLTNEGVPEESKIRVLESQNKITMNKVLINYCPFCGEEITFSSVWEFSIEDLENAQNRY